MKKIIISVLVISLVIGAYVAFVYYQKIKGANIVLTSDEKKYLYIPTGTTFEELISILEEQAFMTDIESFKWVAEKKNYPNKVRPGRYRIKNGMSNNELINLLRAGLQEPISISLSNIRTINELAERVSKKIEPSIPTLADFLQDKNVLNKYGFTKNTIISMFIPDTYEFYWNTSPEEFTKKMAEEYKKFWTEERKTKAKNLNLTQSEVSTLASIVQQETYKPDEKAKVAGVYLNRLKIGMPLQADPTVIFAVGDFSINRVTGTHLKFNSPYNTYLYKGLPPGPICVPYKSTIDAVLDYQKHNYIYFCAKEDFSGYHNFSESFTQHKINAAKYQEALDKKNIWN